MARGWGLGPGLGLGIGLGLRGRVPLEHQQGVGTPQPQRRRPLELDQRLELSIPQGEQRLHLADARLRQGRAAAPLALPLLGGEV